MALSNAERQKRWREKRNVLAGKAYLGNAPLDVIIADHIRNGRMTRELMMFSMKALLKAVKPKRDAELLAWLRQYLRR
jgi:hypothetical protein